MIILFYHSLLCSFPFNAWCWKKSYMLKQTFVQVWVIFLLSPGIKGSSNIISFIFKTCKINSGTHCFHLKHTAIPLFEIKILEISTDNVPYKDINIRREHQILAEFFSEFWNFFRNRGPFLDTYGKLWPP